MKLAGWQDRERYIRVGGKEVVGATVVWRFPVVLPTDIQVWQAKPWPKDWLQRVWVEGSQVSTCNTDFEFTDIFSLKVNRGYSSVYYAA